MIISDLEHIAAQIQLTPTLRKALDFLHQHRGRKLPEGKIEIDGKSVIASIQAYETIVTDAPQMEAHRKYIDVQFIVSGFEIIAWTPLERVTITQPYDEAKDNCFGTAPPDTVTPIYLCAGQLAVFFPEDAHTPRLAAGKSAPVDKIVVKAAV